MTGVTEEMLVAYADGELDDINRRRVERALAEDPALAKQLAAHQKLRTTLAAHYAPLANEIVPDRFAILLQSGVSDIAQAREVKERRPVWRSWTSIAAVAAGLLLGLMAGRQWADEAGPLAIKKDMMVARGGLAHALDTQLASAQDATAVVRIGLTFRAKDGSWCRSFDSAAVSGVACRADEDWRIEQAIPGASQTTPYRQASSADARLSETVEALMAGEPMNATGENAARANGWR
ncbi:anti-sigma factor [Sphingobium sp. SCG-1]|uniref:anti-sigma factor family protein n=1 Tax=Sphingobium sp. SCG-1 TaxID=2072936 RepID=UPI000CD69CB3|nr:zf-HC2 domain-containing protein [Sphingobium sp. SCG-1]AUW59372.1 anti-sigma factor [Sphingobium sp. SCG-1]